MLSGPICRQIISASALLLLLTSSLPAQTDSATNLANDLQARDALQISLLYPSVDSSQIAISLVSQALTKDPQGDWEGMIADTSAALQTDPHSKIAYYTRSYAEQKKGDFPAALEDLDMAVALDPDFSLGYYERSVVKTKMGDQVNALADLNEALRINPKFTRALDDRGSLKVKNGDLPGALVDFNTSISVSPSNFQTYLKRAFIYDSLGNYRSAVADYTRVVTLDPENVGAYNGFAWTYATRPGFNDAERAQSIPYANKACDLSHWRQPNTIDTLAAAYAANGNYDEAVKWARMYLQMRPGDPDAQARIDLYLLRRPYQNPPEPSSESEE